MKRNMEPVCGGKKKHECPICDYSCSKKGSLGKHIQSVHKRKKPHKCSICDYSFSRKGTLRQHIQSVHEGHTRNSNYD